MEGLAIVLGVVYGLMILIGLPFLLFANAGLRRRIDALEARLASLATSEQMQPVDPQALRQVAPQVTPPAAPSPAGLGEKTPHDMPAEIPDETPDETPDEMPAETLAAATPKTGASDKAKVEGDAPAAADRPAAARVYAPIAPKTPETPAQNYVFNDRNRAALAAWLTENWVLAVAALSLVLGGVFMVQYGVENGLLTPFWRVMGVLAMGAGLIAGGEFIRRRAGDDAGATKHLPSTLSGAGLFALFAGVVAARGLYGLIGAELALVGLVCVSALAVLLGWFYGPVLAAVGIVGATVAPFLVGGSSDAPWVFYYYFALIAVAGLAVDTVKRWAWVSAVVLIATVSGAALLFLDGAAELHFMAFLLVVSIAATAIPVRSLTPRHNGPSVLSLLMSFKADRATTDRSTKDRAKALTLPDFPTRLVIGVMAVSSFAGWFMVADAHSADMELLALLFLLVLLVLSVIWMRDAPALAEMPVLPGGAFLAALAVGGSGQGALFQQGRAAMDRAPEVAAPMTFTILSLMAAFVTVLLFWRLHWAHRSEGQLALTLRALSAAVFLPSAIMALSMLWNPAALLGDYIWALHVLAGAALLTLLAERIARMTEGPDRLLRVAFFAVGALVLIALALFLILTKGALTLALAVMVLLTVLLDRRFNLPLLDGFIQLGVVVIGYRLVIDPGVDRALSGSLAQILLIYGGTLVLMAAAWWFAGHRKGSAARVMLESACWTIGGVFANLLLIRAVGRADETSHWVLGPMAAIWFGSAANQIYRMRIGGKLSTLVRGGLALCFTLVGLGVVALLASLSNPLFFSSERVLGVAFFNSLAVACLPVAAVFAVAAWKVAGPKGRGFKPLICMALLAVGCYLALSVRHLWHGANISLRQGVYDGELYSYTVALLLLSVGMLFLAFARRNDTLRKLAMAGVGVTIAKVFLIDMSGLAGLIRVASFMGLGLSLAGLAWLNRVMAAQWDKGQDGQDGQDGPPEAKSEQADAPPEDPLA